MELRNQIFVQAYDWLRQNRRVGNQSDLAQKIGVGTNIFAGKPASRWEKPYGPLGIRLCGRQMCATIAPNSRRRRLGET